MFDKIKNNKHFKYGLPFLIVVVGGSFVLKLYTKLRFEIKDERIVVTKTKEIQKLTGVQIKPKSLEEEYEDYMKTQNLDDWQNKRIPRPWEKNQDHEGIVNIEINRDSITT